ncbi:MAG: T9SS type A sorting domain-containing protein [bacterium]|nr:T9SS type A sorting domain-containing protein [Candidatus Limimorpha equi]
MKKYITIIVALLLLYAGVKAQTYDSIAHHPVGWYAAELRNMMQLRDGNILANVQLFNVDEQGHGIGDYGNRFLKISRHGAVIMDSIFIEDNDLNFFLLQRNPSSSGDSHIYGKIVRDFENVRSDLHLRFFDSDLNFGKEIQVPLCDTLINPLKDAYFIDNQNDIILQYKVSSRGEFHFLRVGTDGNVKNHSVISDTLITHLTSGCHVFDIFDDSKSEYCYWGNEIDNNTTLHIVVLDSLLNYKADLNIDDHSPSGIWLTHGMQDLVCDFDEQSFLVATRYSIFSPHKDGVQVTRYNRDNLSAENTALFDTYPIVGTPPIYFGCAFPIGLAKADDGFVYFSYCTQDGVAGGVGQVSVVKMDADLNIVWQRFCLEPAGYSRYGTQMITLDDGGLAVGGYLYSNVPLTSPELFFLIFDDEGWSVNEPLSSFRPYCIYPNPVKDRLSIHFSPDVKLESIELYDVSGRCVVSSRTAEMNVANLPAGQYVAKITLEDGRVYSDKVVKE